jgi:hypothetical protein
VSLETDSGRRGPEFSVSELRASFPDFPYLVLLKLDAQRRGVAYTPEALSVLDPAVHMTAVRSDYYDKEDLTPVSLVLRDGTTIFTEGFLSETGLKPYVVDLVDGAPHLTDPGPDKDASGPGGGIVPEPVWYWEKPAYYDKLTSSGKPMWQIVSARPQRLTVHPNQFCDFWRNPGEGCKFCVMASTFKKGAKEGRKEERLAVRDIVETVAEALKEPGLCQSFFMTGGSILGGAEPLDDEVDQYVDILRALAPLFSAKKVPSQLIGTAFTARQLERLADSTFLMSYTADLEVLNKDLFPWICPGKSRLIGYEGWKRRLCDAVSVFGRGNVNTGIVGGVELARPRGLASEEEALESTLAEAGRLAEKGVFAVACVWRVLRGSVFQNQRPPSLRYYLKLSAGLDAIRRLNRLPADMDNYRRCGNHGDTDLARI